MTKKAYLEGLNDLNCKFNHLIDDLVVVCKDYQHMFLYFAWKTGECPKQMSQKSGITDFLKIAEVFKEDNNTGVCVRKLLNKNKKLMMFGLHIIMHKQRKITEEDVFHSFNDEGVSFSEHLANVKQDLCEIKCLKRVLHVRFDPHNNYKLKERMIIDDWRPCNEEEEEKECGCKQPSCNTCNKVCHSEEHCECYSNEKERACEIQHEEASCCAAKKECSSCCPSKCEHECNASCESKCSSCCKENEAEKIAKQTCGCTDHICEGTCCKTGKEVNPCKCPASAPCGGKCGSDCKCDKKEEACKCPTSSPCKGECKPCTCAAKKSCCSNGCNNPKVCKCNTGHVCHCPTSAPCGGKCGDHCKCQPK